MWLKCTMTSQTAQFLLGLVGNAKYSICIYRDYDAPLFPSNHQQEYALSTEASWMRRTDFVGSCTHYPGE